MISFSLDGTGDGVTLEGPELIVIGFSGRDGALVERHISELAALGVPRPPQVPMVWKLPSRLLLQGDHVTVDSDATSGEAEPVLIVRGKDHFLAVGSDHTDRELERNSIEDAKLACPKVISRTCWRIDDIAKRWDELLLRSTVNAAGVERDYQVGTLRELLPLEGLLEIAGGGERVVFCGTLPVKDTLDTTVSSFRAELFDPRTGRGLICAYTIGRRVRPTPLST